MPDPEPDDEFHRMHLAMVAMHREFDERNARIAALDPVEVVADALRHQHGLIWSERAVQRQARLAIDALREAGLLDG